MNDSFKEDLAAINRVKKLDSKSLVFLVEKYGKIYDSIVNNFNFQKGFIKQDVMDDKYSFFFEAAKTFDPTKNTKFSTYLYNMTTWKCLEVAKKSKKNMLAMDAQEIMSVSESFDFTKVNPILEKIKTFDERAQYIFMHRFFKPNSKTTFHEIGKELNLTYEGVRQIYLKHIKILKKTNEQN